MKRLMVMALAGMMVLSMGACGNSNDTANETETILGQDENTWGPDLETDTMVGGDEDTWGPDLEDEEDVQIPSPLVTFEDLKEATDYIGFDFIVPEDLEGYDEQIIQVIDTENPILEVMYLSEEQSITLRKAEHDSDVTDISGVYTEYSESEEIDLDGTTVTLKGESAQAYLATWTAENYNYSVYVDAGMDAESMEDLIGQIR